MIGAIGAIHGGILHFMMILFDYQWYRYPSKDVRGIRLDWCLHWRDVHRDCQVVKLLLVLDQLIMQLLQPGIAVDDGRAEAETCGAMGPKRRAIVTITHVDLGTSTIMATSCIDLKDLERSVCHNIRSLLFIVCWYIHIHKLSGNMLPTPLPFDFLRVRRTGARDFFGQAIHIGLFLAASLSWRYSLPRPET